MKPSWITTREIGLGIALAILPVIVLVGAMAIEKAREGARQTCCQTSLLNLGLALLNYADAQGVFPPATMGGVNLPPERRLSWLVLIVPWTDSFQGSHIIFVPDRPRDSPENLRPRVEYFPVGGPETVSPSTELPGLGLVRCPDRPSQITNITTYVGIAGLGADAATLPRGHPRAGVFGYDRQTRTGDFMDGRATTLLLAETALGIGLWTEGGPATVRGLDPAHQPYIGQNHQFGGMHPGGAMVTFADGSVRLLRESIDPKVFEALSTVAGGERLPPGWDR